MRTNILVHTAHAAETPHLMIERFFRDREGVWLQIKEEYRLNTLLQQMLLHSTVALAGYGAVLGISNGLAQALSSAVKLPLLFLLTLAICLPTLYLSNLLFGGQLSARQVFALVLSAITITSFFTLAFAPITFFFLVTAQSYLFFLLLNVAILALTSIVGLQFLVSGVHYLNKTDQESRETVDAQEEPPKVIRKPGLRPANMPVLQIWLLLYAFVGTQLGWTLRPFFGTPGLPFQLFRPIEGNFYQSVIDSILAVVSSQ